jgi:hypothetical protein
MSRNNKPILIIISLVLLAAILVVISDKSDTNNKITQTNSDKNVTSQTDSTQKKDANVKPNETEQLLYLIEEEKLAHDVYTVMYKKYGANVFGNILESESTHQSRVLSLMQTRGIADPRSSELGVFKNTELQKLYDDLIEQGNQSAQEAYKVGVAIEEKDIADISKQLETSTASDVVETLEDLRRGSENHLRAFNRQLDRAN